MFTIIIVGGGIAGARVAQELAKFRNKDIVIKLIDLKNYFEVPYATLRGIIKPNTIGKKLRKYYRDFIRVDFIQGKVIEINPNNIKLENGKELKFNIAIIATGSKYKHFSIPKPSDIVTSMKERDKQFHEEHQKLVKAQHILIIGGGPVGVELAGDIAYYYPKKTIYLVEALPRLLNNFKPRASKIAKEQLEKMGVQVILNEFIERDMNETGLWVSKKTNKSYSADLVYFCIGVSINTAFMKLYFSKKVNENSQIMVNDKLHLSNYNNIYAIGDCSDINEFKLGYLADKQAKYLVKNLKKIINNNYNLKTSLRSYKPKSTISIIPIGKKNGIVQLPIGVFKFKPLVAYKNKDLFIKRQFRKLKTTPNPI